jgi:hypothetical protein
VSSPYWSMATWPRAARSTSVAGTAAWLRSQSVVSRFTTAGGWSPTTSSTAAPGATRRGSSHMAVTPRAASHSTTDPPAIAHSTGPRSRQRSTSPPSAAPATITAWIIVRPLRRSATAPRRRRRCSHWPRPDPRRLPRQYPRPDGGPPRRLRYLFRLVTRASGGIGRRAGFRCQCPLGRGGSSPPSPTTAGLRLTG